MDHVKLVAQVVWQKLRGLLQLACNEVVSSSIDPGSRRPALAPVLCLPRARPTPFSPLSSHVRRPPIPHPMSPRIYCLSSLSSPVAGFVTPKLCEVH